VTRTTVRATTGAARTLDLVLPAAKKRVATERTWRAHAVVA
jgi:hypothetical protein